MYSIAQIAQIIKAGWVQQNEAVTVEHILTDSRKLLFPASSLFFALSGPRRNGISFVDELYQKGVRSFVVEEKPSPEKLSSCIGANFLVVPDVLLALQSLAAFHRRQFSDFKEQD